MNYPTIEELTKDVPRQPIHRFLLEKVAEKLQNDGDSVWITTSDTGRSIKQSEVEPLSRRLASALTKRGLRKGDSIVVFSYNHIYYMLLPLAAWRCGAFVSPIGADCTTEGLVTLLDLPKPRFVFCNTRTASKALEAAARCPYVQEVFTLDAAYEGCTYIEELFQDDGLGCPESLDFEFEEDIVYMPFSSGTTGTPKGVVHNHRSLTGYFARHHSKSGLRIFDGITMHHSSCFLLVVGCLGSNSQFITLENFSNEAAFRTITEQKPSMFWLHPHTAVALIKDHRQADYDFSCLSVIISLGGPLPSNAGQQLKTKIPTLRMIGDGYGTTECLYISLYNLLDPVVQGEKRGTIGKPAENTFVKIVDPDTGTELGRRQQGEICIRNGCLMKGYYNQPKATAETLKDNWLHTGDLGYLDEDGYLYITDRIKDVIKYDTNQVSPTFLESVLLQHEAVKDCGVCGLPDEQHGHLPKAFVVRSPHSDTTQQELIDYVNSRVADYEKLRGGLVFVEQIPRNQVGKILRRVLNSRN